MKFSTPMREKRIVVLNSSWKNGGKIPGISVKDLWL